MKECRRVSDGRKTDRSCQYENQGQNQVQRLNKTGNQLLSIEAPVSRQVAGQQLHIWSFTALYPRQRL